MVGGFHLPSAVCPPSVFGETPSGTVWQELEAPDGPGSQRFMTHNPHPGGGNWSVASAFRPTFVRLRSSPGGWRRRERSPLVPPLAPKRPQVVGWAPVGRPERRRAKVGVTAISSSPPSPPSVRSQSAGVTNQPPEAQLGFRRKGLEFGANRDWTLRRLLARKCSYPINLQ